MKSISTSPKSNSWDTHTAPPDAERLILSGQNLLPDVVCKDLHAYNPRVGLDLLTKKDRRLSLNPGLDWCSINCPPVVPVVEFPGDLVTPWGSTISPDFWPAAWLNWHMSGRESASIRTFTVHEICRQLGSNKKILDTGCEIR